MIYGGDTNRSRKAYARVAQNESTVSPHAHEINQIYRSSKEQKLIPTEIAFREEVNQLHDDALVIKVTIAQLRIHRVMIDTGSSVNVMYKDGLDQLDLGKVELESVRTPLSGFTCVLIIPLGMITLPMSMGEMSTRATNLIRFTIIDSPSAYDIILGRPALNRFKAIVTTCQMILKFPTPSGSGVVKGDQADSRSCYAMMMRICLKTNETLYINSLDPRNSDQEERASPAEELTEVILCPECPTRTVKIGSRLTGENKTKLIELLGSSTEVFAWSHKDMPGINPSVISHKLNANSSLRPIK